MNKCTILRKVAMRYGDATKLAKESKIKKILILSSLLLLGAPLGHSFETISSLSGVKIQAAHQGIAKRKGKRLLKALEKWKMKKVRRLIRRGADLDVQSERHGLTALMWASDNAHRDIVKALIAADADLNLKDKVGKTALMGASARAHTGIVNLLKEAGALE